MFKQLYNNVQREFYFTKKKKYFFSFLYSRYFSKNSTQEILDEVFPKLYPLDTGKTCETFALLSLFLNQNHGYELWFKDCMNLWDTYHNPMWNIVRVLAAYFYKNKFIDYIF